jgi:hypothetical protein
MTDEKKMVRKEETFRYIETTLSEVKKKIDSWIEQYGPDAYFLADEEYGNPVVLISYERLETEGEFQSRIEYETRKKSRRQAEFLKMKKEFEG